MKKLNKILLVLVMLLLGSCSTWKSAQTAFDNGRYVDSVSLTMDYLNSKGYSSLKPEDKKIVIDRFNYIEAVYQAKISQETERQYIELLDYWKILYLIDKNMSVKEALDKNHTKINNPHIYLKQAIDKVNSFSLSNQRDLLKVVVNSLQETNQFIKEVNDSSYIILKNEYYKSVANVYNRLGQLEEQNKNYEGAKQAYYNSYLIYKDYSVNYNNNYDNYIRLDKQLDSEKARNLIDKGNQFVIAKDYVKAVPLYKEAMSLYNKYPNDFKTQINDLKYNLTRAEENVKYQLAEEAYVQASEVILRASSKADYQKAIGLFKQASKNVYNYKDSERLAEKYIKLLEQANKQINPYENIDNKKQQQPDNIYPQYPDNSQQKEELTPSYEVGEIKRDYTELKNYLAITMLNSDRSPYDASYREKIKYDKNVAIVNGKNSIATEYIVTEYIIVSPIITFRNGRVVYDTYKYENKYREYVYRTGAKRIDGVAYGPQKLLNVNKNDIDVRIKGLINNSIR